MSSVKGKTEPRIYTPPLRELTPETTLGYMAAEFARDVMHKTLYPWQIWLLVHMLEIVDAPGQIEYPLGWHFRFRVILCFVARQNGKTTISEVIAEFFLLVLKVELTVGTSLSLTKAQEVWEGVVADIQEDDDLSKEIVGKPRRTNGNFKLTLTGKREYKVVATGRRAGRGDPIDLGLLDELREQRDWSTWSAMSNGTNAKPNGVLVCFSNAGDVDSVVLRHLRNQALRAMGLEIDDEDLGAEDEDVPDDDLVGIFEWSAEDGAAKTDEEALAQANPALGYGRLTMRALKASAKTTPDTEFRTECMCQIIKAKLDPPFSDGAWDGGVDDASEFAKGANVALGLDVSADRARAAISAAGLRSDRLWHVEVLQYRTGSAWVVRWLTRYVAKYGKTTIALQSRGAPSSSLVDELKAIDGLEVIEWQGAEIAAWTGRFFDSVEACAPNSDSDAVEIRHRTQPALDEAAGVAAVKSLGDSAKVFNRTDSPKDISTLVSCVAAFGAATRAGAGKQTKYQSAYKQRKERATGLVVV